MSRHFYLTDMDHRSHHANVHKYKRKKSHSPNSVFCMEIFDCEGCVGGVGKSRGERKSTCVTHSQIMLG